MRAEWTPLIALAAGAAMLAGAVWSDTRQRRIPNRLVFAGCCAALALSLAPGGIGIGSALGGMAAGFALLLPLHLLRVVGAGDVKLMAAVGAFTGFPAVLTVALITLLAGGALSFAWAVHLRQLRQVLHNVRTGLFLSMADVANRSLPRPDSLPTVEARVPYAVAIAAGAVAQAWLGNT
jgi:prepilin peptidase CpaA